MALGMLETRTRHLRTDRERQVGVEGGSERVSERVGLEGKGIYLGKPCDHVGGLLIPPLPLMLVSYLRGLSRSLLIILLFCILPFLFSKTRFARSVSIVSWSHHSCFPAPLALPAIPRSYRTTHTVPGILVKVDRQVSHRAAGLPCVPRVIGEERGGQRQKRVGRHEPAKVHPRSFTVWKSTYATARRRDGQV